MNCAKSEELLSRAMDGELPAAELREFEAHLGSCPRCAALRDEWARYSALLREPVAPVQTAEAMWADVQRAIRRQREDGREEASVFGWRLRWAGVIIALVLLGAYGVGLGLRKQSARVVESAAAGKPAEVEFVETDVPGASALVYEDAETGWMVIWVAGMEPAAEAPRGS